MVIDHPRDAGTVFAVFAARARQRSPWSLAEQLAVCGLAGAIVLLFLPSWWALGAALGAAACYAGWGLLDRGPHSSAVRLSLPMLATLATALAFLAAIGVGLAAFTGDARGPYGTCYDVNGRAFACDARGQRR
jgi:hypothetical protein